MSNLDLHEYARLNLVAQLDAAIATGADVNQRNAFGSTPLHCAIAKSARKLPSFCSNMARTRPLRAKVGERRCITQLNIGCRVWLRRY